MPNQPSLHPERKGQPPLEYDKITEQIFVGTNACCVGHFDKELLTQGVVADISLELEQLDQPKGVEYFLWLPTKDHTAPKLEKLRVGAHVLRELIDCGEKVYVHCKNGHGRAPTLVAAYFILMGDTAESAIQKVGAKRPATHIEPEQHRRLEEFEQWCRARQEK